MADELIPLDRQRLDVLPVLITFLHTFRLWDHARDEDSGDSHMQSAGLLITDSESDSSQDAPFLLPFWPSQISVVAPPRMPSPPACSAVQYSTKTLGAIPQTNERSVTDLRSALIHQIHHFAIAKSKILHREDADSSGRVRNLLQRKFPHMCTVAPTCASSRDLATSPVSATTSKLKESASVQVSFVRHAQHTTSQHSTSHHITTQHTTAQHTTARHNTPHHNTSHHNTAHHNTAHHITSHHITTHHSTARNEMKHSRQFT